MSLSVTHGTIARGSNPHRGFALVGIALGVFAILFLGSCAAVVASLGGPVLFYLFAGVMAVGAGLRPGLSASRDDGLPRVTQPRRRCRARSGTALSVSPAWGWCSR
jgi:hypothetical protein